MNKFSTKDDPKCSFRNHTHQNDALENNLRIKIDINTKIALIFS